MQLEDDKLATASLIIELRNVDLIIYVLKAGTFL
jgi:hypothetical protein